MHMDRHLGLEGGGRELEGKADLLGLLGAVSPGKKLKLESPLKQVVSTLEVLSLWLTLPLPVRNPRRL